MAKADFLTGLVIFVLGVYMLYEGLRMPGAGGFIEAGGEPGRVPALLGAILALLALALISRAIARGGHRLERLTPTTVDARIGVLRSALTALICSLYALGLLGATVLGWQVKYQQATFLFLFLFITGFEWPHAVANARRSWLWLGRRAPRLAHAIHTRLRAVPRSLAAYAWLVTTALLQAALITLAVTYLFAQQFYVKLP